MKSAELIVSILTAEAERAKVARQQLLDGSASAAADARCESIAQAIEEVSGGAGRIAAAERFSDLLEKAVDAAAERCGVEVTDDPVGMVAAIADRFVHERDQAQAERAEHVAKMNEHAARVDLSSVGEASEPQA